MSANVIFKLKFPSAADEYPIILCFLLQVAQIIFCFTQPASKAVNYVKSAQFTIL